MCVYIYIYIYICACVCVCVCACVRVCVLRISKKRFKYLYQKEIHCKPIGKCDLTPRNSQFD